MEYTPGPAGPALYPGQRGKERPTASSLDPCAESRLTRWALPDRRLLGVDRWFEPGDGCRLGPLHGPRLWRALFRVTPKRHQKVEPDNLKPVPAHFSALCPQRPLPRAVVAPAALRHWLLAVRSQYTCFPQRIHHPVVRYSACTFGQCPVVQLALGLWLRRREALETRGSASTNGRTGRAGRHAPRPHRARHALPGNQRRGVVFHNPQGDAVWDGTPTAFGRIMAWLAEVETGDWEERMVGDNTIKRKELRPPIRVEALLPRWAQVTRPESVVSGGPQVPPSTAASALPWAQSDRPKGLCECRNVVLQSKLDYPLELIPPARTIPLDGRCLNGCAVGSSSPSSTIIIPACVDRRIVLRDPIHLYLWAMSFRTKDMAQRLRRVLEAMENLTTLNGKELE